MKKRKEVYYSLTFKGLLSLYVETAKLDQIMDAIELQLYRGKNNAVVFEDNDGGSFVHVSKERI